ncbi:cell wall-binding repeat-containing protein [Clostridium sp.]|uniref:cell wall-binding repeat-containing protein n=1 Tax=Clostridium sp. TaxID=1506 RepID=UPI003216B9DE
MYFTTRDILANTALQNSLKDLYFDKVTHKKVIGIDRYETATKISQEGWNNGSGTVLLVNGHASADGLAATPLASAYDAPILLTQKDHLIESTKNEIKRLNPTKVILVGGDGVISNSIVEQVKSINSSISIERLGGITRYDTSLLVAKKLDQISDVTKAYVCYGHGEADALSIASKAGEEKAPIILVETQEVPKTTLDWLKGETLETAYFIGGTGIIYDNVIKQMNNITSANVTGNRVCGNNRYDTNAEVIKRFYSSKNQPQIIVSKGTELADALTAGPLASKLKSPILILSSELEVSQRKVLETKKIPKLYEVGGGMNPSAISEIIRVIK